MPKYVYDFAEGSKELVDLLGGKGANLAEMAKLGLPVPPGFTITTEACREFMETGSLPAGLRAEVDEHLARLESVMGKKLGDANDPLLVSVRSGAKFSMPGMMDTVLNVGLNDTSVDGLAKQAADERFAWDSYRRLVQMFGKTVMGVTRAAPEASTANTCTSVSSPPATSSRPPAPQATDWTVEAPVPLTTVAFELPVFAMSSVPSLPAAASSCPEGL